MVADPAFAQPATVDESLVTVPVTCVSVTNDSCDQSLGPSASRVSVADWGVFYFEKNGRVGVEITSRLETSHKIWPHST